MNWIALHDYHSYGKHQNQFIPNFLINLHIIPRIFIIFICNAKKRAEILTWNLKLILLEFNWKKHISQIAHFQLVACWAELNKRVCQYKTALNAESISFIWISRACVCLCKTYWLHINRKSVTIIESWFMAWKARKSELLFKLKRDEQKGEKQRLRVNRQSAALINACTTQSTAAQTDSFFDLFENRLQMRITSSCHFHCNRIACEVWIFAYLSKFISKFNKIEILQSNLNESIRKFISIAFKSNAHSNRKINILLLSSMLVSMAYDKWWPNKHLCIVSLMAALIWKQQNFPFVCITKSFEILYQRCDYFEPQQMKNRTVAVERSRAKSQPIVFT